MIKFVEHSHQYFNDDKELISVTTLMTKHHLAPDYSMVKTEVLERKAERGSLIHKEIERFNKAGEIGFTDEMLAYKEYIESHNIKCIGSEVIVYNDVCAGTLDLLLNDNGTLIIADLKTTSSLHKDAVSWQLSIYNYLNGWTATKAQAFHFNYDGELRVVDIPFKPKEEVEKLMTCERNKIGYSQELPIGTTELAIITEAERIIEEAERMKKEAEERRSAVKDAILKAMEDNGLAKFENERIRLTYIAPSVRNTIDTARLKKDHPDIAEAYMKQSNVKASLKIALKGD